MALVFLVAIVVKGSDTEEGGGSDDRGNDVTEELNDGAVTEEGDAAITADIVGIEESENDNAFFCKTGKKNIASLFVGGYKFWHNKNKTTSAGDITGYFYCCQKKKPPYGFHCKASATATKILCASEDGDNWQLVTVNSHHTGTFVILKIIK